MTGRMGRYEWGATVSVIATYRDLYGDQSQVAEILDTLALSMGIVFARDNQAFNGQKFLVSCGVGRPAQPPTEGGDA